LESAGISVATKNKAPYRTRAVARVADDVISISRSERRDAQQRPGILSKNARQIRFAAAERPKEELAQPQVVAI
jgi:hypothetical protein